MLEELKEQVFQANQMLPKYRLVTFTWGNASGIDRTRRLVVIKPSGVEYDSMVSDDMVVVDLSGNVVEGKYKPSSDMLTHIEIYKEFKTVGGVVHTHSKWAASFAQAGINIPAMGTTQSDYFHGDIPCTRRLTAEEIASDYEKNTGKVIVETFCDIDPIHIPGVLVHSHGPFTWGTDALNAVHNSLVLEEVAFMNYHAMQLNPNAGSIQRELLDKHFFRKHGKSAYYGQPK